MTILKYNETIGTHVKDGVERRLVYTDNLMTVIIDFSNGPWKAPDPLHAHPHEQTTYVAAGEVMFICEGELDQKLIAGDLVCVPSNKKHAIQLLSNSARLIDSFNPIRVDFLK